MSTIRELRDMNDDELRNRERELADELFRLRLRRAAGQLASPMKPRDTRRTLARVKTLLRERAGARGGAA
jgi:large subunit ribosomal protein L29